MAKVYKAEIYITDANGEIGSLEDLEAVLKEMGYRRWVGIKVADAQESEEFEWDDDLVINKVNAQVDDFEVYFKSDVEKTYLILFYNRFACQTQTYKVTAENVFRAARMFYRTHDRKNFKDCIELVEEI